MVAESGRFESPTAKAMGHPSEVLTRFWDYRYGLFGDPMRVSTNGPAKQGVPFFPVRSDQSLPYGRVSDQRAVNFLRSVPTTDMSHSAKR